jgi:hypothetical protein
VEDRDTVRSRRDTEGGETIVEKERIVEEREGGHSLHNGSRIKGGLTA